MNDENKILIEFLENIKNHMFWADYERLLQREIDGEKFSVEQLIDDIRKNGIVCRKYPKYGWKRDGIYGISKTYTMTTKPVYKIV